LKKKGESGIGPVNYLEMAPSPPSAGEDREEPKKGLEGKNPDGETSRKGFQTRGQNLSEQRRRKEREGKGELLCLCALDSFEEEIEGGVLTNHEKK